ncbi:thiol-disulfide oxidoreductase DCC family protein [Methyloligella solikamskensis]|uniref:Thiol-disulfide oxidoreductase DCC family protein n=1 Tax=Methyloligella solikamskensis TaxID=1177756 RepID=A0ABW3J9H9_9HYPH
MLQSLQMQPYSYRIDPSVPSFPDDRPILVFDGKCVLCSRFAQFVIRHDPKKQFRFLAAQTALGQALYRHFGLDTRNYESNILLDGGRAYLKWGSAVRVGWRLGFPWSGLAMMGWLVPPVIGDRLYDLVAQNRIRLFGGREQCYVPGPSEEDRFIA